jgi:hypothetical protein
MNYRGGFYNPLSTGLTLWLQRPAADDALVMLPPAPKAAA